MEEKKLNEKESLELITQMIRQSRRNMVVGSGNRFLLYGYFGRDTFDYCLCACPHDRPPYLGGPLVRHVPSLYLLMAIRPQASPGGCHLYRPHDQRDLEGDRDPVCDYRAGDDDSGLRAGECQFRIDDATGSDLLWHR